MCVHHDVRLVLWIPYATFTALNLPSVPSSPLEVNSAQSCYLCADEQAGWFMYYLSFFFFLSRLFFIWVSACWWSTRWLHFLPTKQKLLCLLKHIFLYRGIFLFNCLFDVEYIFMCTSQHVESEPLDLDNLIHKHECLWI